MISLYSQRKSWENNFYAKNLVTILFAVLESRLDLRVFSVKSGHTKKFKFLVGKKRVTRVTSCSLDNTVHTKSSWHEFYDVFHLNGITLIFYCDTRFELPGCIFLIFSKTWSWCKLIALCCQPLVQLNNQEYHFPLANHLLRVPERRQALKNSSLRVLPNTLQCLWVPPPTT